jgi:hypothetical protein
MPDSPEVIQTDQAANFVTMWIETTMGVRYALPDMLPPHVDAVLKQLFEAPYEKVTAINISEACLILPKRIIGKAGVGDRIMWEK